jgi:hypothetical protein
MARYITQRRVLYTCPRQVGTHALHFLVTLMHEDVCQLQLLIQTAQKWPLQCRSSDIACAGAAAGTLQNMAREAANRNMMQKMGAVAPLAALIAAPHLPVRLNTLSTTFYPYSGCRCWPFFRNMAHVRLQLERLSQNKGHISFLFGPAHA